MAFSVVAHVSGTGTTAGIDTTGADLIVVFTMVDAGSPSDSKGNTWTALTSQSGGAGTGRLYYSVNPTVGAAHTFSAGVSYGAVGALAISGAAASPFDQQNGAGGFNASSFGPGSVTPTEDDEIVIAAAGYGSAFTGGHAVDSGFTLDEDVLSAPGTTYGLSLAHLIQTTAAAASPTFSTSDMAQGVAVIASFKAAGGGGGPVEQNLAGSCTPAGTLAKLVMKGLVGSTTPAGALAKAPAKVITGSATAAGAVVKDAAKPLAGSSTPSGSADNVTVKVQALAGSSTPSGALAKDVSQAKGGSSAPAGAVAKAVSQAAVGQVAPAGTLAKQANKAVAGSATPAGSVSNTRAVLQALAGAVSAAGALAKGVFKALAGFVTASGSATNQGGEPTAAVQVVDLVATDSSVVDLVATDSSLVSLTARRPT